MYLFNNTRENFLRFLPKNAVVAEIGVATGDFSAQILALSKPKRFHLIDPWVHQSIDEYKDDPNNVEKAEADKRYTTKIKDSIANQSVLWVPSQNGGVLVCLQPQK